MYPKGTSSVGLSEHNKMYSKYNNSHLFDHFSELPSNKSATTPKEWTELARAPNTYIRTGQVGLQFSNGETT